MYRSEWYLKPLPEVYEYFNEDGSFHFKPYYKRQPHERLGEIGLDSKGVLFIRTRWGESSTHYTEGSPLDWGSLLEGLYDYQNPFPIFEKLINAKLNMIYLKYIRVPLVIRTVNIVTSVRDPQHEMFNNNLRNLVFKKASYEIIKSQESDCLSNPEYSLVAVLNSSNPLDSYLEVSSEKYGVFKIQYSKEKGFHHNMYEKLSCYFEELGEFVQILFSLDNQVAEDYIFSKIALELHKLHWRYDDMMRYRDEIHRFIRSIISVM